MIIPGPSNLLNLPLSHLQRIDSDPTSPTTPHDTSYEKIDFPQTPINKKFESDCMSTLTQQQLSTGLSKQNQQIISYSKFNEINNEICSPKQGVYFLVQEQIEGKTQENEEIMLNKNITNQENSKRLDTYGTPILKGKKKHKIIFDKHITVMVVENWKQYNTDLSQKPSVGCKCRLF